MLLHPHSKLVMIGDSITDCDRYRPIGDGGYAALGHGYVELVAGLLGAVVPQQGIRIINMGIAGNTVRDLQARWQSDVLDLRPDWLSIMIGINDVWRHFDLPNHPDWQVPLAEYAETLSDLVRTTRPALKGLVLMTPFFIEPNRAEPMRAHMDRYGAVVRELAERYDAVFVDTQAAFDAVLQQVHPAALAGDRVHPNIVGHMLLARAFLQALGFVW